jgi:mannose-6-phosphate isomerase-like protein (cupin superfamily)
MSSSEPTAFHTAHVGLAYDLLAPDGSEIRQLGVVRGASVVHCSLPPGRTSLAIRHRTVEEIWFVLAGRGQVWRRLGGREEVVDVEPGVALTIPLGVEFQFRTVGPEPLRFVIATIPPWPGAEEAVRVKDYWQT